jgi:Flp pilus assembly pilin Flp
VRTFCLRLVREERGAAASEYGLVVGVMSAILLLCLVAFAEDVRSAFDLVSSHLPGFSTPKQGRPKRAAKRGRPRPKRAMRRPAAPPPPAAADVLPSGGRGGKGKASARQQKAPAGGSRRGRQQQQEREVQSRVASSVGAAAVVNGSTRTATQLRLR